VPLNVSPAVSSHWRILPTVTGHRSRGRVSLRARLCASKHDLDVGGQLPKTSRISTAFLDGALKRHRQTLDLRRRGVRDPLVQLPAEPLSVPNPKRVALFDGTRHVRTDTTPNPIAPVFDVPADGVVVDRQAWNLLGTLPLRTRHCVSLEIRDASRICAPFEVRNLP
jgi:hypothetical protein